jgi:hypothetical protein
MTAMTTPNATPIRRNHSSFLLLRLRAGALGKRGAGVCNNFHLIEEALTIGFREGDEDLLLKLEGDHAGLFEDAAALWTKPDAMCTAIGLVGAALDELCFFHAREGGRDGVRVTRHEISDGALGEALGIALADPAEDGELIRGNVEGGNALAKGLIQTVPGAAQKHGETLLCGRGRRPRLG